MEEQIQNKTNNIKISVIVPAYNVEKYMEECLNSIINQTYTNLEIIVVDDGSKDKTPQIIDSYVKKDDRIKFLQNPHLGVSVARNTGLKIATGDYISFIDSDDSIELDAYEKVVEIINKDKDIDFISFFIKSHNYHEDWRDTGEIRYYDVQELLKDFVQTKGIIICSASDKVYKKQLIENLSFCEGKYYEDGPFVLEVLFNAKKACVLFRELYNYRLDVTSSISHVPSERVFDAYYILDELKNKYKSNIYFCQSIDMLTITHAKHNLLRTCQSDIINDNRKKQLTQQFCKVVKSKRNAPILIDSLKERLKLKSFVLFPELYAFVYRHKKYKKFKEDEE